MALFGTGSTMGGFVNGVSQTAGALGTALGGGPDIGQLFSRALTGDTAAEAELRALAKHSNLFIRIPAAAKVGELDARRKAAGLLDTVRPVAGEIATVAGAVAGGTSELQAQLDPRRQSPTALYLLLGAGALVAVLLLTRK